MIYATVCPHSIFHYKFCHNKYKCTRVGVNWCSSIILVEHAPRYHIYVLFACDIHMKMPQLNLPEEVQFILFLSPTSTNISLYFWSYCFIYTYKTSSAYCFEIEKSIFSHVYTTNDNGKCYFVFFCATFSNLYNALFFIMSIFSCEEYKILLILFKLIIFHFSILNVFFTVFSMES